MQSIHNIQSQDRYINWSRFNSVFIIEVTRGEKVFTSTAVAISKNKIITAAHSVDGADSVRIILADQVSNELEFIDCTYWIIHPGYNPSKSFFKNDVAVIYLESSLPIFIASEEIYEMDLQHENVIIERIGHGSRNNQNIKTWTNPQYLTYTFDRKNFVLKDSQSVLGDSGGPVYWVDHGMHKLVGIHSTLEGDNKTYIVNLAEYIDWIENLEFNHQVVS